MPSQARAVSHGSSVTELARLDAGLEDGLDPALVRAAPLAELLGPLAGERRELVQEHPDVIRVAVDHVEQLLAEHGQLLPTASRRPRRRGRRPTITSSITRSWMAASSSSLEPM